MSTENPWVTRSRKIVYENPWLRLHEHQVVRPDGLDGIYGYIETRPAVGVCAVTASDEIVLVGQYRYPTERYSWEIPEGGAEVGESPLAAARRELAEEAGVIAHDWSELGPPIQVSNCISAEMGYLYLARDLEETTPNPDGTEVLEVAHIGLDECWRWVADGRISDSLTLLALHRWTATSRK